MEKNENYIVKIGMCDDNLNILNLTSKMLESSIIENDFNAEIVEVTDDQNKIFELVKNKKIDILFLDVDFKNHGQNGIEFAKKLREYNKDFFIIYLTAHQRYMHISFYVKVFDYLIKPISREVLDDIVLRLKNEFEFNDCVFLHLNKWLALRTEDIVYIERIQNKSLIYTNDVSYETYLNLENLLDKLPRNFVKSHRSYIVNTNKIKSIDKKDKMILFENKLTCPMNSHFNI